MAKRPDEPEDLTLPMLRRMDEKLDALSEDTREVKQRVGHLEGNVASLHVSLATLSRRVDRVDERFARVERRLNLFEPEAP